MFPEMKEANPPTTPRAIEDFERGRGLVLPELYRQFLLATNGGRPKMPAFPIEDMPLNPSGSIKVFLGIGVEWPVEELRAVYDLYAGGPPSGVVPIASTGTGDYVCLDLRKRQDRVAFWDHRSFWGSGIWRESDFYSVAKSFAEFLASLRPSPY